MMFISKSFGFFNTNLSMIRIIYFIADKNNWHEAIFIMVINLFMPFFDSLKCSSVTDIKHNKCTSTIAKISSNNGGKLLLSSSIPYMGFNNSIINYLSIMASCPLFALTFCLWNYIYANHTFYATCWFKK